MKRGGMFIISKGHLAAFAFQIADGMAYMSEQKVQKEIERDRWSPPAVAVLCSSDVPQGFGCEKCIAKREICDKNCGFRPN